MSAPVRPTSALGFRPPRANRRQPATLSVSSSNSNLANGTAESTLLDENGLPLIGHLLAFTPDVIQAFQDAAKLIEESREIKKQAMNQIKDAFNDAKAYSLTVNQSVAQKLADIITLAVRDLPPGQPFATEYFVFLLSSNIWPYHWARIVWHRIAPRVGTTWLWVLNDRTLVRSAQRTTRYPNVSIDRSSVRFNGIQAIKCLKLK